MFELSFSTSNAIFEAGPEYEIVRILDDISNKVRDGYTSGNIVDLNGNSIGKWAWKE